MIFPLLSLSIPPITSPISTNQYKDSFQEPSSISVSSSDKWFKIINHTSTDISKIPIDVINAVKANCKLHYAHTSHGGQLTTGISRIELQNSTFDQERSTSQVPNSTFAFSILDGQIVDTYITPDEYWETETGVNMTIDVINNYPVNISMWSFCTQTDSYSEAQIQEYLDQMNAFELEYPDVVFVYITGNAQGTGSSGYNRYLRNQQIRQYCLNNSKWLFDFGDLDAWNGSDQQTYDYLSQDIPTEHDQFNGNEAGHTTYESCEIKGKALWYLMARITGWGYNKTTTTESFRFTTKPSDTTLQNSSTGNQIFWIATGPNDTTYAYNIYKNQTPIVQNHSYIPNSQITLNVDETKIGTYNYTITITNGTTTITDEIFIHITDVTNTLIEPLPLPYVNPIPMLVIIAIPLILIIIYNYKKK
ncbi:MAG: hypothetical protein ACTSUV_01010 [Candidatus Ranarchaeia archaeon]